MIKCWNNYSIISVSFITVPRQFCCRSSINTVYLISLRSVSYCVAIKSSSRNFFSCLLLRSYTKYYLLLTEHLTGSPTICLNYSWIYFFLKNTTCTIPFAYFRNAHMCLILPLSISLNWLRITIKFNLLLLLNTQYN